MTWNRVRIESFCDTGAGGTPSRAEGDRYFGGDIPWVKSGELKEETIFATEEQITKEGLGKSAAKMVPAGALLVALYGATVGRIATLGINAATNQAVCHIVPRQDSTDPRYLFHALKTCVPHWLSRRVGGAQPNISQQIIRETEVPHPPLAEQRRIADILDRAEALRASRRAALALLDTLPQAIFIEMFGDPRTNRKGWQCKPLTEVCHCYSGGTPSKDRQDYWEGNLPWFSAKDMKQDDLYDATDHVNLVVTEQTSLKLLPADTVAIVVRGMILAHTFPVCVLRIPAVINQDLKALLPRTRIEPQFLAHSLRAQSAHALGMVSEAGHGTKRLDTYGLHKIMIPLPPLPLQQAYARRVAAVEALRSSHRASLAALDELFASLQYRAFRGEL